MTALSRIQNVQKWARQQPASSKSLRHIVIVGGGSAGWMAAAALSNVLGAAVRITLVESEQIGTVGVGEATIPTIRLMNQTMGVDEQAFFRDTQATFKLGIEFVDWGRLGHRYFHPFSFYGRPFDAMPVHQYWLKHRNSPDSGALEDYSLAWHAARLGRFALPTMNPELLSSSFNYAFHFDASLYAQYLRKLSEGRGVHRQEGRIVQVHRHAESGFVSGVQLETGELVGGDFFIDCSGFDSLLLGKTLGVGYDSWSQWLPCDRAVAMPCELDGPPIPYTRSTALEAGWQWTIPLRHRVGNGYVFSSNFITPDLAKEALQTRLPGQALGEPRLLKFTPGRRQKAWDLNVLALGLASGFLEPLESTSLHLVHSGISTLLNLFPDQHCHDALRNEYNRRFAIEMERIRDFLILHYKLNTRQDSEMWRYCAHMKVPEGLAQRMNLFKQGGHLQIDNHDLFGEESWLAVHLGQENFPNGHNALLELRQVDGRVGLAKLRQALSQSAQAMPTHEAFLQSYIGKH